MLHGRGYYKMDRRIKRTRIAVFNALMDLLIDKDSSKITVLELCKKADINKSTFYLHYKSLDECIESCFKIIMNGIVELAKKINIKEIQTNPEPAVNKLLDEVEKNVDYLYRLKNSNICGNGIKVIKENLVSSIAQYNGINIQDNYYEYIQIAFAVAGCIDVLIEPLPVFDKKELSKAICSFLRKQ